MLSPDFKIAKKHVAIAALAIGVMWGGTSYAKSRPEYSLWQLQQAVRQHDLEKFNHYVDTDAVAASLVQTMRDSVQEEMAKAPVPTDVWSKAGYELGKSLAEGLLVVLEPAVKKMLDGAIKDELLSSGTFSLDSISVTGSSATAVIKEDRAGVPSVFVCEMAQQADGEWKIVGLGADTAKEMMKQKGGF
jgi:hypothetical protein